MPYRLLEEMSPQLTRKFARKIKDYDCEVNELRGMSFDEEEHNIVCTAMFRSVLTQYVYQYQNKIMRDTFTRDLVVQTLDSVPGLRSLYFPSETHIKLSAQLSQMIHHLRQPQVFTFIRGCTDELVEQLALNCSHLKKLSLPFSRSVRDASVEQLMKLEELEFLDLSRTEISYKQYGTLLSNLKEIKNIAFQQSQGDVLHHVAPKRIDSILHVGGYDEDMDMLAEVLQYNSRGHRNI